jgi:hypothetical protein
MKCSDIGKTGVLYVFADLEEWIQAGPLHAQPALLDLCGS